MNPDFLGGIERQYPSSNVRAYLHQPRNGRIELGALKSFDAQPRLLAFTATQYGGDFQATLDEFSYRMQPVVAGPEIMLKRKLKLAPLLSRLLWNDQRSFYYLSYPDTCAKRLAAESP